MPPRVPFTVALMQFQRSLSKHNEVPAVTDCLVRLTDIQPQTYATKTYTLAPDGSKKCHGTTAIRRTSNGSQDGFPTTSHAPSPSEAFSPDDSRKHGTQLTCPTDRTGFRTKRRSIRDDGRLPPDSISQTPRREKRCKPEIAGVLRHWERKPHHLHSKRSKTRQKGLKRPGEGSRAANPAANRPILETGRSARDFDFTATPRRNESRHRHSGHLAGALSGMMKSGGLHRQTAMMLLSIRRAPAPDQSCQHTTPTHCHLNRRAPGDWGENSSQGR